MKAIRVHQTGPPEVMRIEEVPVPKPRPGQVLVQVKAAGVNPVDTYVRAGQFGYAPELPYTPGADAGGVVKAVGSGVTRLKPGDRVYGGRSLTGSYAELALFEEPQVHPLPEGVSFQQGACVGIPCGTAYQALFHRGQAKPGETVLVHGASGGVGSSAVQLAKSAGLTVIGTAGSEEGLRLIRQIGADQALDHRSERHFDEALRLTGGKGVNVILEMLANVNLGQDLKILADFGRVVVIGSRGPVQIDPRDAMVRCASVLGMVLKATAPEEFKRMHAEIGDALSKGILKPVVGRELPLAQAPEAHRAVMTPPAHGNIVLIP